MNELIKIQKNDKGVPTVNARDLHEFLGVGNDFSTWIKNRIKEYDFIENVDYSQFLKFQESAIRARLEYHLSLDMAKSLAMVEKNEKGKQARAYFLECEKIAKEQQARFERIKHQWEHLEIEQQKLNSKRVNTLNYVKGGKPGIIKYNVQNCIGHTNKYPKEVIQEGKELGLKSKDTSSAKQVLRKIKPETACCMSLTDHLVQRGFEINKAIEVSKKSEEGFKALIEVGYIPAELN